MSQIVNPIFKPANPDQFLEDFKADADPTVNLKAAVNDHERGRIDPGLLKIKVKLAKDPSDYAVNNPDKKIGVLLGAKADDVIWYFKTTIKRKAALGKLPRIAISKYGVSVLLSYSIKQQTPIISTHCSQ